MQPYVLYLCFSTPPLEAHCGSVVRCRARAPLPAWRERGARATVGFPPQRTSGASAEEKPRTARNSVRGGEREKTPRRFTSWLFWQTCPIFQKYLVNLTLHKFSLASELWHSKVPSAALALPVPIRTCMSAVGGF
ncbi:hypothetical protein MHYP_G00336080 [Metynnis hypsauchen]